MKIERLPLEDKTNGWSLILPPRTPNPALAEDITADWVVVGAGYAGLAAARRLAENRPDEKSWFWRRANRAKTPPGATPVSPSTCRTMWAPPWRNWRARSATWDWPAPPSPLWKKPSRRRRSTAIGRSAASTTPRSPNGAPARCWSPSPRNWRRWASPSPGTTRPASRKSWAPITSPPQSIRRAAS